MKPAITSMRVTAAFVVYLAFSVLFFLLGPLQEVEAAGGIVDDDFGSSPDEIVAAVDALGPAGQDAYRLFLYGDLVYPLLQAAWMTGFIVLTSRRWRQLPQGLAWVPVAAMAFDWIENLAILAVLNGSGAGAVVVAMHLKLVAVIVSVAIVAACMGWWITHPVRR